MEHNKKHLTYRDGVRMFDSHCPACSVSGDVEIEIEPKECPYCETPNCELPCHKKTQTQHQETDWSWREELDSLWDRFDMDEQQNIKHFIQSTIDKEIQKERAEIIKWAKKSFGPDAKWVYEVLLTHLNTK